MLKQGMSIAHHLVDSIGSRSDSTMLYSQQEFTNGNLYEKDTEEENVEKKSDKDILQFSGTEDESLTLSYPHDSQSRAVKEFSDISKVKNVKQDDYCPKLSTENNSVPSNTKSSEDSFLNVIKNSPSTRDMNDATEKLNSFEESVSQYRVDTESRTQPPVTNCEHVRFPKSSDEVTTISKENEGSLPVEDLLFKSSLPLTTPVNKELEKVAHQESRVNSDMNQHQFTEHPNELLKSCELTEIVGINTNTIDEKQQNSVLHVNTTVEESRNYNYELFSQQDNVDDANSFIPTTEHLSEENALGRRNSSIMCVDLLGQYQGHAMDENTELNQFFQGDQELDYYQHQKETNIPAAFRGQTAASSTNTKSQQQLPASHLTMQHLQLCHPEMDEVHKQQNQQASSQWETSNETVSVRYQHQPLQYHHDNGQQFHNYQQTLLPLQVGSEVFGGNQHSSNVGSANEILAPYQHHQLHHHHHQCQPNHQNYSFVPHSQQYPIGQDDNVNNDNLIWVVKPEEILQPPQKNQQYESHNENLTLYYSESANIHYVQDGMNETGKNQQLPYINAYDVHEATADLASKLPHDKTIAYSQQPVENRMCTFLESNTSYNYQRFSNVAKYDTGGGLIEYRPIDTVDSTILYLNEPNCNIATPYTATISNSNMNASSNNTNLVNYDPDAAGYHYQHADLASLGTRYLQPLQPPTYLEPEEVHEKTYHMMGQSKNANNPNGISDGIYAQPEPIQDTINSKRLDLQSSTACYNISSQNSISLPPLTQASTVPQVSQTYEPIEEISSFLFDNQDENSSSSHDEETDTSCSAATSSNKYTSSVVKARSRTAGSAGPVKEARCSAETLHKLKVYLEKRQAVRDSTHLDGSSIRKANNLTLSSSPSCSSPPSLSFRSDTMKENSSKLAEGNKYINNQVVHQDVAPYLSSANNSRSTREIGRSNSISNGNVASNSKSAGENCKEEMRLELLNSTSYLTTHTNSTIEAFSSHMLKSRETSEGNSEVSYYDNTKVEDKYHQLANTENRQLRNRIIVINPQASPRSINSNLKHQNDLVDTYSLRTRSAKRRRIAKSQDQFSETDTSLPEATSGYSKHNNVHK